MQVVITIPETSRELHAVGPDMANVLAVIALIKSCVSSIWFYLDDNMVQATQLEYLLRF
jgi:hypothetical protein